MEKQGRWGKKEKVSGKVKCVGCWWAHMLSLLRTTARTLHTCSSSDETKRLW